MLNKKSIVVCAIAAFCLIGMAGAWPWSSGPKYCDYELDALVVQHCHPKWFQEICEVDGCSEGVRGKRAIGDLQNLVLSEEDAKSYMKVLSRNRRASMQEECCKEGCRSEEVNEIC